jgi:chromosome segregation ATPase
MSDSNDVKGPSAESLIEQLEAFMQQCESLLDRNIEPDLTGMDDKVAELQNTISELKFDQLQQIQPALQALMDKLSMLESRLREERDEVRKSLQSTEQQKQAHNAYQKVQSSTSPKTEGEE